MVQYRSRSPPCASTSSGVGFRLVTVSNLTHSKFMFTKTTARFATMVRISVFALASLALPMSLIACSEHNPPNPAPTSTGTTSPSSDVSSAPAPEDIEDPFEAAIAAYLRFDSTLDEAAAIPDPEYPQLEDVAADDGLVVAQEITQSLLDQGLRNTGRHTYEFEIKDWSPEQNPNQIALIVCTDSSDTQVIDLDTGEPASGEEYGKRHVEALVELRDGRWLVTDIAIRGIGSCLPSGFAGICSFRSD